MPINPAELIAMMQDPALAASGGAAPLPPGGAPAGVVGVDDPTQLDPALAPMADPMSMPGAGMGMGSVGAFPSTDPTALAQAVQDALASLAGQDHAMLESQQQQAALAAQPIIDQMMLHAAAPPQDMGADPMMAFGESAGMPPLPPEGMVA